MAFDDASLGHEATVQVELTRQNRAPRDGGGGGGGGGKASAPHAYAPRFPKVRTATRKSPPPPAGLELGAIMGYWGTPCIVCNPKDMATGVWVLRGRSMCCLDG